jgi:molecular chaperone DnaK
LGSKEDLETKTKELSDALTKVGEAMYKKQDQDKPQDGEKVQDADEAKPEDSQSNGEAKTDDSDKKDEPVEGEVVN